MKTVIIIFLFLFLMQLFADLEKLAALNKFYDTLESLESRAVFSVKTGQRDE